MTSERPIFERSAGRIPAYSGGKPMAPTATMTPCPGISRGTDIPVPMPPGLVSVSVVPA